MRSPDSFRAGTALLVASLRHTVVVNTATASLLTNFENTITRSDPFRVDGEIVQLGRPGEVFRISIEGQLESPGPPSGWIAGTAFVVGAATPAR